MSIAPPGRLGVGLDSFAEFASEEALPPRRPRKRPDDEALDAFEVEPPAVSPSSVPDDPSTAATSRPFGTGADLRTVILTPGRFMAATAGIIGVVALSLLVRPSDRPLSTPDAPRTSTVASATETRPRDLAVTPASRQATLPAPPVEGRAEPGRQSAAALAPPQEEPAGPTATATPALPAVDLAPPAVNEEAAAAPSATTGNVVATNAGLKVDPGIDAVLPAARPAPRIPAVNLAARPAAGDSPPPSEARSAPPSAEDQVGAVLGQFRAAYSRLDAGSVQAIWPSVDRPRLERAFRNLEWQDLEFNECRLDVAGVTATAICTGVVEYDTRVGSQRAREARRWTFALREASTGWLIHSVLTR